MTGLICCDGSDRPFMPLVITLPVPVGTYLGRQASRLLLFISPKGGSVAEVGPSRGCCRPCACPSTPRMLRKPSWAATGRPARSHLLQEARASLTSAPGRISGRSRGFGVASSAGICWKCTEQDGCNWVAKMLQDIPCCSLDTCAELHGT